MHLSTCSGCHQRRLLFPSQVVSVHNTDGGIDVSYECLCGTVEVVHTGRSSGRAVAA